MIDPQRDPNYEPPKYRPVHGSMEYEDRYGENPERQDAIDRERQEDEVLLEQVDERDRPVEVEVLEDEDPCVLELHSRCLTRWEYKSGEVAWKATNTFLIQYEQDLYEEAFALGRSAAQAEGKLALEMAYGKGVVDAAVAAYGGKGATEEEQNNGR